MSPSEPSGSSLLGAGPLPSFTAARGRAPGIHQFLALEGLLARAPPDCGWSVVEQFVLDNKLSTIELYNLTMVLRGSKRRASDGRAFVPVAPAASASAANDDDDDSPAASPVDAADTTTTAVADYQPAIDVAAIAPAVGGRTPSFPAYAGHFKTSAEAKAFRSHARVGPKVGAEDVERVKKLGRPFWVRRLYEAMVDIEAIQDSARSVHRDRFENAKDFSGQELEACAHKIFDAAIAVHEVGWTRPRVYHKRVVRGKLADVGAKSLEVRLLRLCEALKGNKAMVDDAMRGGISLALLVDNPAARSNTKVSNNAGNKKRGERLMVAKRVETEEAALGAQQEEEEEDEEDISQETVEDGE